MVFNAKLQEVENFDVGDYVTLNDFDHAGIVNKVADVKRMTSFRASTNTSYDSFAAPSEQPNAGEIECQEQMARSDELRDCLELLKMLDFIRNLTCHRGMEPPD